MLLSVLATSASGLSIPGSNDRNLESRQVADELTCPFTIYTAHANVSHEPYSTGKYHLGYQRPPPSCRTWNSTQIEDNIEEMRSVIKDPDLFRIFENSFPNTLDTTVRWKGTAEGSDEELSFIITGDIDAMWIRDSAAQLHSYLPFVIPSDEPDSFASLFRGAINLQARYLLQFPYCNAFQPPPESGLAPANNTEQNKDTIVTPTPDDNLTWQCKYELDSVGSFFQLSTDYYSKTGDFEFFGKYQWVKAVEAMMQLVDEQLYPTYQANGSINIAPYTFQALTFRATETFSNNAYGNPVNGGTGLVRSGFRPSDDACIYELFIPANMQLAYTLETTVEIVEKLGGMDDLVERMKTRASLIRGGIEQHAIINGMYAFEVDGYGGLAMMDDAGVPSLLSAPFLGYVDRTDPVYQKTRKWILSEQNPYWMRGPVLNAVGSPHIGPGWSWPMGTIMQIITSDDDAEIVDALGQLVASTDGLGMSSISDGVDQVWTNMLTRYSPGLMHESIFASNQSSYTRPW
ncbi:hypothetical protein PMZ80_005429 [Knufia obscura]|uniref:Glycoside hydrolase family 125 protein n=1 Tax=Knufia obscura TaxID=1635080 RepID=A0ABR0RRH9_9EURO|nr:hypothetical protein PMZ80_005429 [Knufia obscura]